MLLVLVREVTGELGIEEYPEELFNKYETSLPTKNRPKNFDAEKGRKSENLEM